MLTLIAQADLVLRLVPAAEAWGCGDGMSHAEVQRRGDEILVFSKSDLIQPSTFNSQPSTLLVSSKTGEGLDELRKTLTERLAKLAAKDAEETGADVTTRQKECLLAARDALERALAALEMSDWVVAANEVRDAAESLGRVLGKVYSEDLLTALFSRFCVGK